MKAAVLEGKNNIQIEDIEIPEIKSKEVLVKVMATGICGSDLPRVFENAAHNFPIILGHEFSGYVVDFADDVTLFEKGDHVAGIPLVPCMECIDCKNGNYSLCKQYSFVGSRQNGSLSEYIVLNEKNLLKIDKNIPYETAAFFEPSTVALHGIYQSKYKDAKNVVILGGGTIGLFTLQWVKILGAEKVTVTDIDMDHLKLAKQFGADYVLETKDENFLEKAKEITDGRGFDYVFMTTGAVPAMKSAFELASNKAHVCFIGTPTKDITFSIREWENMNRKEFYLTGSWMSYSAPWPGKEWEMTAEHFAKGDLKIVPEMIFKSFPIDKTMEAFNEFTIPGNVSGKVQIRDF